MKSNPLLKWLLIPMGLLLVFVGKIFATSFSVGTSWWPRTA